jgi:hypothetical protein
MVVLAVRIDNALNVTVQLRGFPVAATARPEYANASVVFGSNISAGAPMDSAGQRWLIAHGPATFTFVLP